jgi:hypothetical protein
MLINIPSWVTKSREELDEFVDDLIRKNHVDWIASHDSQDIESGKEMIMNTLWRIHESVNVEQRKDFEKLDKALNMEDQNAQVKVRKR